MPGTTTVFDLTILPLNIISGREQYELPGLLAVSAPRKAERIRAQDLLVIYMRLLTSGGKPASFTHAQQKEILSRLAETYFNSVGSVTAGLRMTTARLNDFLLNRNLKAGQEGQTVGVLSLVVSHSNTLVIAQNGSSHAFFITQDKVQHFDDGQGLRGLGLSRQATPRFYQLPLAAGEMLVLSPEPPMTWSRSLAGSSAIGFEGLRRRLVSNASAELTAVTLRFSAGKGQVSYWRPASPKIESDPRQVEAGTPISDTVSANPEVLPPPNAPIQLPIVSSIPADVETNTAVPNNPTEHRIVRDDLAVPGGTAKPSAPVAFPQSLPINLEPSTHRQRASVSAKQESLRVETNQTQAPVQPSNTDAMRVVPLQPVIDGKPLKAAQSARVTRPKSPSIFHILRNRLAAAYQAEKKTRTENVAKGVQVVPVYSDPLSHLSPALLLLIAVIVPIMVVTIATTVYFRAGRTQQFDILFGQAEQYAQQAANQQDPLLRRQAWTSVYNLVQEAEKYGNSDLSTNLRRQSLAELDVLEGISRLEFQPAMTGSFGTEVNITRMVATLNQVFLLDANQGRILSMNRITSGSYEIDRSFSCSPAKAGAAIVGPLIDLAELTINNEFGAEIMGIDAGGNLVYCSSGDEGFVSQPLALPDAGWGSITGITTYGDTLYVLDPKGNAVYVYFGDKGNFSSKPHFYFGNEVPNLGDVIDLAVDQEFLYLLHADGQMTMCTAGGVAYGTTRCTDPTSYGDSRAGMEPAPLTFPGAQLNQIQTTLPPDPSLFALDISGQAVYHLSQRRLNLQHIYMNKAESDFPFPNQSATAFAVTPNRRVLVAVGSQVFFAPLP